MKLTTFSGALLALVGLFSPIQAEEVYVPGQKIKKGYADFAQPFLKQFCTDCHDDLSRSGKLSLENLGPVDETNAAVWKSVWAQVALQEMPPRKSKNQPPIVQRLQFSDWIVEELKRAMQDKGGFQDHLDPNKGNFVDHNLLFGPLPKGIELQPTSSPTRLWRVTPLEHVTRLNELFNKEPAYDPKKPGLRAHGDAIPTNHGGELKLYFGIDRILSVQGGTVAYATAVKSVPSVLSNPRSLGLKNYPHLTSVNSAEATLILGLAEDILRYMIDGPLSIAEAYQITDNPKSIADKMKGDLRGLPTSIVYSTKVVRPLTPVYDFMQEDGVNDESLRKAVNFLFEALTFRPPTGHESDAYLNIAKQAITTLGKKNGTVVGLSAIFLDRDALFRPELARQGKPDTHGRVLLQDWELGLSVNHAFRYLKPDEKLREAIVSGNMRTRDDVKRELERMLADDSIRKPRVLQFFRDYFDYDRGGYICKDTRSLQQTGVNVGNHYRAMFDGTASTDRLVELILAEDKDVFRQMLTTNKVVVAPSERNYYGAMQNTPKQKAPPKGAKKGNNANGLALPELKGPEIFARVSRPTFGGGSLKPNRVLATAPEGQRLGILTHPTWLVSHSDAMDNHAIHRGKWVRERLLGGGIPDVPITVDAMLPDEPTTLRQRMRVTRENYCWTCHQKMDPLGLPFELFNHAGVFRTTELGKPVDTTGEIIASGDPKLDGKVANAFEMIQKIAASERAEQVFVRHAFRFWMGRNETLNDRIVLQDAYKAYKESGGSMKALLISLLTSDAFLYRKPAS
ncbi:MAG: DUF1588 domain-containing protein [Zavarzinella sp.]